MIKDECLVSTIITTHNRLPLLKKAIRSVEEQTYKTIELIIVDDNSSDGTREYLNSLVLPSIDFNCIFIDKQESKGGNYARNKGIEASRGELIAFLDDDDEWLPRKIEEQVKLIKSSNDIGFVYCSYFTEDDDGNRKKYRCDELYQGDLSELCFQKIFCTTSMILCKRDILIEAGCFDEKLNFWQEYDLCIRLCALSLVGYVDEPLMILRILKTDKNRLTNKYDGWLTAVNEIEKKYTIRISALPEGIKNERKLMVLREQAVRCDKAGLNKEKRKILYEIFRITKNPKHFIKALFNYAYFIGR